MNVLAGSGLVGIVTQTGPHWATVRSIIDDESNVSSMVLTTSDQCMVRGDLSLIEDGKIKFEQLENNDNEIKVGEQIVTSHISDKYLQGILVGYISEINVDANNLTRSGYITPVAVSYTHLRYELILCRIFLRNSFRHFWKIEFKCIRIAAWNIFSSVCSTKKCLHSFYGLQIFLRQNRPER